MGSEYALIVDDYKINLVEPVSVQLRLDQSIRFSPVYNTCSLLILLVLHTCLAYIKISIVHYYLHTIYKLFSLSLSHFILLTKYQSHCSDVVVFFGVLPLPSPSPIATVRSESPSSHPTTASKIQSIHQSNRQITVTT